MQEWDGDYTEEEPQPSNTNQQPTPRSPEGSKHVAPSSAPPAKTASKELFPEQVHPPGTEQSLPNVLQEIDELFDIHSEKLLNREASTEREGVVHAQTKTNHSLPAQPHPKFPRDVTSSKKPDVVNNSTKRHPLQTAQSPRASGQEEVIHDSFAESESQEERSDLAGGNSITIVDQSSQDDDDDDETQLPTSPPASRRSPIATASSKSAVKKCLMPSTSPAATLSDSSQSDFMIDMVRNRQKGE